MSNAIDEVFADLVRFVRIATPLEPLVRELVELSAWLEAMPLLAKGLSS